MAVKKKFVQAPGRPYTRSFDLMGNVTFSEIATKDAAVPSLPSSQPGARSTSSELVVSTGPSSPKPPTTAATNIAVTSLESSDTRKQLCYNRFGRN